MTEGITDKDLIERWTRVCEQVRDAQSATQKDVCLLAVSKTKPADMIMTLVTAGQKHFGENYLQEAIDKIATLKEWQNNQDMQMADTVVWHYIGHIQRNKTRDIAENFDWVHTVERDIIAKRLNNQRPDELSELNVLIQVNIDHEESKSGCDPKEVDALVESMKAYKKLRLRGLMIIPSKEDTGAFARTKKLFDEIKTNHPELQDWDTLSMGMSADMEEAIAKGSTMVRVGSAIFGERE